VAKLITLTGFFIVVWVNSYSQCTYVNNTFQSGEKVSYNVYYKLGFLWFNAAEVSFSVKTKMYNNKKVFHFDSYGQTLSNYDWIYKVRDHFQSYSDSVMLSPLFFSRVTSEGSYKVNEQYIFDSEKKKIYSSIETSNKPKITDTLKMQACTFDVLTAIYACRNTNITKLVVNDTIPIIMLVENKTYNLYLRYLGVENIKLNNDKLFRCRKFSILMIEGTIFSGGEDVNIWISDDKAKVPMRVEAHILVGSIIAEVDIFEGNKWPLNSQINEMNNKK